MEHVLQTSQFITNNLCESVSEKKSEMREKVLFN